MSIIVNAQVLTSEQSILACILRGENGRDYIGEAESRGLKPEMFAISTLGRMYETAQQLRAAKLSPHDAAMVIHQTANRTGSDKDELRRAVKECLDDCDATDANYIAHVDAVLTDFYNRGLYELMDRCRMEGKDGIEATIAAGHFIDDYHRSGIGDGLPDFLDLSEVTGENLPPLAPELIHGVLRRGHVMVYTGASKSGKSFSCINLALSVATGGLWLNNQCEAGNVLYVNFEIQDNSVANRYQNIMDKRATNPGAGKIHIWNLRGKVVDMETVTRGIIDRVRKSGTDYSLVIIDPIYKVFRGDENSAGDVGRFFALLDKIAEDTGAAVCICHHHSKGAQEGKSAMDRGSGSGVFARSPDALVDAIEVELPDEARDKLQQDTGEDFSTPDTTALKIEYTAREFAPRPPEYVVFKHPVYYPVPADMMADARSMTAVRQAEVKRKNSRTAPDFGKVIPEVYQAVKEAKGLPDGMGVDVTDMMDGIAEKVRKKYTREYSEHKFRAAGYRVKQGRIYSSRDFDMRESIEKKRIAL